MYEEWLRSLGLFSPEKMRLLSCGSNRTQRNSMELHQGRVRSLLAIHTVESSSCN